MSRMRRRGFLLCGLAFVIPVQVIALTVYVVEDGQVSGPFDTNAIKARLGSQAQAGATLVWMQGMADWAPASQVPALAALVASLPLDPPFDAAQYVIGSWASDDQVMEVEAGAIRGRVSFTFSPDGALTYTRHGSHLTITEKPNFGPGPSEIIPNSIVVNQRFVGTYSVVAGEDGFFRIKHKGTVTDHVDGKKVEKPNWEAEFEFIQMGPNHMRTRYGVNYYKKAG